MATRIGIISDVHASPKPLKEALEIFNREKVSEIICAGDIAGYYESIDETIDLLKEYNCKTIQGNHDQSFVESCAKEERSKAATYLGTLPGTLVLNIENLKILVVHAHPPASLHGGIKLLDQFGEILPEQKKYWEKVLQKFDYDVLIVGHTHQVYAQQLGAVFVVNPGSTQFNHSCMVLSLPDLTVQVIALENRDIEKTWNYSKLFSGKITNQHEM